MKGEVEKVWKNETADGRKYEVLQIDGERYSLWDEDYLDRVREGQSLEFNFKEAGDFKNITEIYDPPNEGGKEPDYGNQKLKKTVRMSCLKSASRILAGTKVPYLNRADKAIEIAKKFEKYIDDEGLDSDEE